MSRLKYYTWVGRVVKATNKEEAARRLGFTGIKKEIEKQIVKLGKKI